MHIFSGRSDEVRNATLTWLYGNSVWFDVLKMRRDGDHRPDEELKREWIQDYDMKQILCVFDDRTKLVKLWRELGLACFQVAPSEF